MLHLRSKASRVIRDFLDDNSFTEVETPVLLPSSPEGAREFLVPTRYPKEYYALAQSPQIFKVLIPVRVSAVPCVIRVCAIAIADGGRV